jgi:DNA polymerase-3 subunit gamma/tau
VTQPAVHQALYRRWRAQTFAEIVGQTAVVETLRNAVRLERVSHAILFVGPRGTGKTSLARILAKALNCTDLRDGDPCDACPSCIAIREGRALDLVEIDAASNRGIDAIRELRERIQYAPTDLRRKVYILDEAHQITRDAWNALLKSLEEPPDSVVFMFASTHPQDFPPAVMSRLQRFDVRRLSTAEIEGKLTRILKADRRDADPGAVRLIARLAAGGMRDAESMLDQLLASAGDRLDEARVRDLLGLAEADEIDAFIDALVAGDAAAGIGVLDGLDERGRDARGFLDQVVDALRARLTAALTAGARDTAGRLVDAARRLASIDPNRAGTGGLRLQLELALFAGPTPDASVAVVPVALAQAAATPARSDRAPAPAAPATGRRAPAAVPVDAGPDGARKPPDVGTAAAAMPASSSAPAPDAGRSVERPSGTAAASPAAAQAAEPSPGGPIHPDLAALAARWTDVVASVRPATRAVISECRPLAVEGNVVTLGFPEAKAFLKDHAERKRPDLEAALTAFLGRTVAVRCVATNIDLVTPAPDESEAAFVFAEARKIFADDLVDVGEVG